MASKETIESVNDSSANVESKYVSPLDVSHLQNLTSSQRHDSDGREVENSENQIEDVPELQIYNKAIDTSIHITRKRARSNDGGDDDSEKKTCSSVACGHSMTFSQLELNKSTSQEKPRDSGDKRKDDPESSAWKPQPTPSSQNVVKSTLTQNAHQAHQSSPPSLNGVHHYPMSYPYGGVMMYPYRIHGYSPPNYLQYPSMHAGPPPPVNYPIHPMYNPYTQPSAFHPSNKGTPSASVNSADTKTPQGHSSDPKEDSSTKPDTPSNETPESHKKLNPTGHTSNFRDKSNESSENEGGSVAGVHPHSRQFNNNQHVLYGPPHPSMMIHPMPPSGIMHPGFFMSYPFNRTYQGAPQNMVGPSFPILGSMHSSHHGRGIRLSLECDVEQLSEYQIMVRQQLEIFEAGPEDVESNTQGRKKPVALGQIGLRCRHCASVPLRARGRGAVYYPAKLHGIYQAAQNMAGSHLCQACQHIPEHIKEEIRKLRDRRDNASGGKQYWADGCRALGIYETENGLKIGTSHFEVDES